MVFTEKERAEIIRRLTLRIKKLEQVTSTKHPRYMDAMFLLFRAKLIRYAMRNYMITSKRRLLELLEIR